MPVRRRPMPSGEPGSTRQPITAGCHCRPCRPINTDERIDCFPPASRGPGMSPPPPSWGSRTCSITPRDGWPASVVSGDETRCSIGSRCSGRPARTRVGVALRWASRVRSLHDRRRRGGVVDAQLPRCRPRNVAIAAVPTSSGVGRGRGPRPGIGSSVDSRAAATRRRFQQGSHRHRHGEPKATVRRRQRAAAPVALPRTPT